MLVGWEIRVMLGKSFSKPGGNTALDWRDGDVASTLT